MPEANVNTTDLQVPQTMQMDMTPTPEPIKPENDEADTPPVFTDPVRQAIFAKRQEQLTKEMADQGLEPPGITEDKPELEVKDVIPEAEPAKAEAVPEPKPEIKAPERTPEEEAFILNVYGQEKRLTKDQVIREAQKGMAASQIFEEGYRMKNEALQVAQAVRQNLQPQQAAKENPPPQQSVIDKDTAIAFAKRINYGSEEDHANAVIDLAANIASKIQGQAQFQSLPPEQIAQFATQQAVAAIENRTMQETLKTEFGDILGDKAIASAADIIANELNEKYRSQGIAKSHLELFREAGKITREKYLQPRTEAVPAAPINPPAAPTVKISDDKIERKRAAPKPPVAANKVAQEPPPSYGVGVSSIVQQMRKSRGQPVFN